MTTIIEQILEEIWEECKSCRGKGNYVRISPPLGLHLHSVWQATEKGEDCLDCKGKGKVLTVEAKELFSLILKEKYCE